MNFWIEGIVNLLSLILGWLIALWIAQTKSFQRFHEKFHSSLRGK